MSTEIYHHIWSMLDNRSSQDFLLGLQYLQIPYYVSQNQMQAHWWLVDYREVTKRENILEQYNQAVSQGHKPLVICFVPREELSNRLIHPDWLRFPVPVVLRDMVLWLHWHQSVIESVRPNIDGAESSSPTLGEPLFVPLVDEVIQVAKQTGEYMPDYDNEPEKIEDRLPEICSTEIPEEVLTAEILEAENNPLINQPSESLSKGNNLFDPNEIPIEEVSVKASKPKYNPEDDIIIFKPSEGIISKLKPEPIEEVATLSTIEDPDNISFAGAPISIPKTGDDIDITLTLDNIPDVDMFPKEEIMDSKADVIESLDEAVQEAQAEGEEGSNIVALKPLSASDINNNSSEVVDLTPPPVPKEVVDSELENTIVEEPITKKVLPIPDEIEDEIPLDLGTNDEPIIPSVSIPSHWLTEKEESVPASSDIPDDIIQDETPIEEFPRSERPWESMLFKFQTWPDMTPYPYDNYLMSVCSKLLMQYYDYPTVLSWGIDGVLLGRILKDAYAQNNLLLKEKEEK